MSHVTSGDMRSRRQVTTQIKDGLRDLHNQLSTLDRLERAGWIARERDPADRRAVSVRALPDRGREIYRLFAGMNTAMDSICADYDQQQLELLADFLHKLTDAGHTAARTLADSST